MRQLAFLLPTTQVYLSDHQASISFSGEQVLLNHQSGIYYGLNNTGAFIWELVSGGCTVAGLWEALLSRYEISPEQAKNDVTNLLQDLEREGLVRFQD